MMETYAERLKREGRHQMTNYDMDEIERMKDREKRSRGIEIEKDKKVDIELELSDGDFLHLAKAAHERNITLNQLCVDVLTSSFSELDYRFEHNNKQILKEY